MAESMERLRLAARSERSVGGVLAADDSWACCRSSRPSTSRSRETVVVASLAEDGGWTARDERNAVLPVSRANGAFLAVTVPAGEHRVRLRYSPPGSRVGLLVTLGTAIGTLVLAVARRRRPASSRTAQL